LRVPVIAPPVNSKSGLSLIEPIPRRPCTHTGKGCASRAHHREGVRWRYVPTGRDVRGWSMLGDREDELDLADIGGETGAATHGASMAGQGRRPKRSRPLSPFCSAHDKIDFPAAAPGADQALTPVRRWREESPCLGIELMDLPVPVLPHPERLEAAAVGRARVGGLATCRLVGRAALRGF
jgi:hypothetical protein